MLTTVSAAINRRAILLGMASASAIVGATASATPSPIEDPALLAANERLQAIRADLAKARDDLDWIRAEWRHLWPLAPEEILGGANAHIHGAGTIERDITGLPLMRDKATLTKRLSRKFRAEGGQTCFALETADQLSDRLAERQEYQPRGRTPAKLAQDAKRRERLIRDLEKRIAFAREYEAATERLRTASNVRPAIDRVKALRVAETSALADLMGQKPATHAGVATKAAALLAADEWSRFTFRDRIASDVMSIASASTVSERFS